MAKTRHSLRGTVVFFISILCVIQIAGARPPSELHIKLITPYWDATVDAAGYGDLFNWGYSPYHPHQGWHE